MLQDSLFGAYGFRGLESVMMKQGHGDLDFKVGDSGRERVGGGVGEREEGKEGNWEW